MNRGPWGVLLVFLVAPTGLAHEGHGGLDEELLAAGDRLMWGGFEAAQPGPLLVVPYREGPLPCGPAGDDAFLVALDGTTAATFLSNATHILAAFERTEPGFYALAVDTQDVVVALIMMERQAVALHTLAAWGVPPGLNATGFELRTGTLGIPYRIPGSSMHSFGHDVEGGGIAMAYDEAPRAAFRCGSEPDGPLGLALERARFPGVLEPGRVVHAAVLADHDVDRFLPRPLESTSVLQVNLYLSRPGEDARQVRASFEPGLSWGDALPWLALVVGLGGLARGPGRT